ncbi:hypothetical protein [Botrimarina sp.]|uniref:hypothetical protein n=1 Tax=Botrimarina sp. TaxID=2795802 RepID=UPI0032EC2B46
MLPDIKIALPILFVLWCAGSLWAMQSPVMLIYPAMWVAVGLLFLVISKMFGAASGDAS